MTRYFHGGTPYLRVGELLLPPARSGAHALYDDLTDDDLDELAGTGLDLKTTQALRRRDVVYVTTELADAELFARLHPAENGGNIYEVDPLPPLEPDPDYKAVPCASFTASEARVTRIVRTNLKPTRELRDLIRRGGFR